MENIEKVFRRKIEMLVLLIWMSSISISYSLTISSTVDGNMNVEAMDKVSSRDSLKELYNIVLSKIQAENELKSGNFAKAGKIFYYLGNEYSRINDKDQALLYYYKAMTNTPVSNVLELSLIKEKIGDIYLTIGDNQKALVLFNENKNLYEKAPAYFGNKLINNYINIGRVYAQSNKSDSGFLYFNKAQLMFDKSNSKDSLLLVRIYNNIGGIYIIKNDFEHSEKYLLKALEISLNIKQLSGYVNILLNLAIIEESRGNIDKAISYLNQSLEYSKQGNITDKLAMIYNFLNDLHAKNRNFEEALKYANLYKETQQKYYNARMYSDISNIKTQYEVDKIGRKLELSEKEARIIKMQRYIALALAGIFLILAIFFIAQLRLKTKNARLKQKILDQEKNELEKELSFKSKEIENFASHIIQKNIFLEDLKKNITDTASVLNKESSDMLKKIATSVSNNLYIDKDRKEFEMKIDHHYHKLLTKLSQKHPTLTPGEVRLCSLILMELNTKEIAILQNISTLGVKKNRYRLRLKLGLTREQNLLMYLQSL